tara:strand:- start:616 stop:807 length:192 start_codon:yes stop_codon:yes gene_type:complete
MTDTNDIYNGWGASTVATKYIYERIGHALNAESTSELEQELSNLYTELAHNYKVDTGKLIGDD